MSTTVPPVTTPPRPSARVQVERFWRRVTDGLELNQLWSQFQADARASYRLYAREIDASRKAGVRRGRHWWGITKQFFWAILEKLSPARRVLLLLALLLIISHAGRSPAPPRPHPRAPLAQASTELLPPRPST